MGSHIGIKSPKGECVIEIGWTIQKEKARPFLYYKEKEKYTCTKLATFSNIACAEKFMDKLELLLEEYRNAKKKEE